MSERSEYRRLLVAWSVVLGVGIAHRIALVLLHRSELTFLLLTNQTSYYLQYLPQDMLRDQLMRALLVLQQTPPVPSLAMGIALKALSWPDGARLLIGLQSLSSLLTAAILVHLLSVLYPRRVVLWIVLGLLFVLDTDLVVLEFFGLGQTVYEPLSMLAVMVILAAQVGLRRTGRLRWAVTTGVATGLLILTRATWFLFPIPCLLLVAMLAPARRTRAVLACLVPILVLQGGWTAKNYAVYGVLSPATSAWGGLSALTSLGAAGIRPEFEEFRRAHGAPRPLHSDLVQRDEWVMRTFGVVNPILNTATVRSMFAEDQRAFLLFAYAHPGTMLRKWWLAYHVFWQPIANYGRQNAALFTPSARITDPFDVPGIVGQVLAGSLPDDQYVTRGTHPAVRWSEPSSPWAPYLSTPTNFYTVRWLDPFALILTIAGVHLLLPVVGILWVADRLWHGPDMPVFDPLRMAALLVAATLYGYLAAFVNLVEMLENMRFRLEVKPAIWVITLICVTELARFTRASWRRTTRSA